MKNMILLTIVLLAAAMISNMAVAADDMSGPSSVVEGQYTTMPDSEHGDAAHASSEKKKGLPQLDPKYYPSQIFWLTFMFLSMYLLFSKKILPEMSSTIEGRRQHIQEDLDSAEQLKEEAENIHDAYDKILQDSHTKSSSMFAKVEDDIKKKTTKKLEKFQDGAVKSITEMEGNIEAAKKDAMKDMHSIAAETARIAAEKIIGVSTDLKQAETVVKNIDKKAA